MGALLRKTMPPELRTDMLRLRSALPARPREPAPVAPPSKSSSVTAGRW
jgi:hypothetical protein